MTTIRPLSDTNHAHLVDLRTTLDDIRTGMAIVSAVVIMNTVTVLFLIKSLL